MKVLVTGGTGFLGRAVCQGLLARGHQVTSLSRHSDPELEARGVVCLKVDLRHREGVMNACRGQDLVVHTAARAGIWGPPQEYAAINLEGTRHVLEGCLAHGVPRLVYTSSPSVTFEGGGHAGADESLPYARRFLTPYQKTKAAAEQMVLEAHGRRGLSTLALRPHLIWGPGDPHLVPRVVAAARAGRLWQVGDGQNLVDLTYIDSAAHAHVLAADRVGVEGFGGRAYFINGGPPVKLWAWIGELLQRVGAPPVRRRLSYGAAYRLGAALEWLHAGLGLAGEPRMTRFLAAQLAHHHYYDTTAARRDLGYEPLVSMEEGLDRLVEWLRATGS